jgi:HK97 family phage major capsid protein
MKTTGNNAPFEKKADDAHQNAGTAELKNAVKELANAFDDFKKANDVRLKEVESKGAADPLTEKNVKALDERLSKAQEAHKAASDAAEKRMNELEKAIRRPGADDGKSAAELEKKAQALGREIGRPNLSVDEYKAYGAAFDNYVRRNNVGGSVDEIKALSVGSDPAGGYAVLPDTSGQMVKMIYETSPMRQIANVVTIGTDALEGNYDLADVTQGWVGETESRTETTTPTIGTWRIPVHEQYAEPRATQKLLDDAMFDVEGWLAEKVADRMARVENTAFVTGSGINKPKGFLSETQSLNAPTSSTWSVIQKLHTGTNGGYGSTTNGGDKLTELLYMLKGQYRARAKWLMTRTTLGLTRKLKDGQGNYLWQPDFSALNAGKLLGLDVMEAADMYEAASNDVSVALGDFMAGYQIVDRQGIRVLRDAFTAKPYVKFYTTKRTGGAVVNFEAIKLLKFAS